MKLKISHVTEYKFSSPVFLEPHYLRFKPREKPHNHVEHFILKLSPKPVSISEQADAESNTIHLSWFEGLYQSLKIKAESLLEVHNYNPFNFILYPLDYAVLPFTYSKALKSLLNQSLSFVPISSPLSEYGVKIKSEVGFKVAEFLTSLTKQIHSDFVVETRLLGEPHDPNNTFKMKKGSCRDIAWMQIQLLRSMGIASRFVSGYYHISTEGVDFELHAWLEVFLPGAGWIGFDPSHGIVAGSSHIPVVSSAFYENTMPVTGTIRGEATSELESNLLIETL